MKKTNSTRLILGFAGSLLAIGGLRAQDQAPAPASTQALNSNAISQITNGAGTANSKSNIWGYAFGDYAYMGHGDSAGRGTKIQYKGLGALGNQQASNPNAFEIRRAYLGFNYNINSKFAAYALMAYEGDYDVNNNRTVYLKYAYFKWKGIFKGSDLKIGQQATNSFANAYNTEPLLGYRSVEKTIMDMHGVDGSSDMGVALEGKIWHNTPADSTMAPTIIGYSAMIGDNSGNTPVPVFTGAGTAPNITTDKDKKYRLNAYVNTLNGALTIGAYTDYLNYGDNLYNANKNFVPSNSSSSHHNEAVQTIKAYAVYNSAWFGIGVEWFTQTMTNGELETWKAGTGTNDTVNASQTGLSIFAHGTIIPNKLNIFARYDMYTPDQAYSFNANETFTSAMTNLSTVSNVYNGVTTKVAGNTYKESFVTAGLDWSPTLDKKVHIMPNIWYYMINNGFGSDNMKSDNYMLYRITFLYAF
jgi:hypothetical protein